MFDQGPDNEQYTGQRCTADSHSGHISGNSHMVNDNDNNLVRRMKKFIYLS